MDNIKTVDDLIKEKKLTLEEREFFKDLIQETKDRDERIALYSWQARENLKKLSATITIILEQTSILSRTLVQTLDEMETYYLRSLPAERFYRE